MKVRLPSGGTVDFVSAGGGSYSTSDCCYRGVLTKNVSNLFVLTELDGSSTQFDANGMPDLLSDAHGNVHDVDFNGSLQFTGVTTDRGSVITAGHDANGWVNSITMPGSVVYTLSHDSDGNLTSITTPATPDQVSGITTTLNFDSVRAPHVRDRW